MNTLRRRQPAGVLWATAIVCTCAAAQGEELRIRPSAIVDGESVLLSHVADLINLDPSQSETLSRIVIYPAPRPGGEIVLHVRDIRAALVEAGANLATICVVGSARCAVTRPLPPKTVSLKPLQPEPERPKAPVPSQESPKPQLREVQVERDRQPVHTLEAAVRQFIEMRAAAVEGRIEIRFSPAGSEALAHTSPPYEFRVRSKDDRRIGLLSLEADLLRDGAIVRTVPLVAEASLVREVVVARRAINRGETIEGRALKLEARRFTNESEIGLTDPTLAIGRQSSGFVQGGQMLTSASVQDKPMVTRGQAVTIWMRRGGLVIRASGKAQGAGGLGDRIEVLREGTRRKSDLLDAVVTGPGTVSVEPTQVALGAG